MNDFPQAPPPSPWDMVLAAINDVRSRLDRLVSVEVHQADLRRVDARLDDLVADVGMVRATQSEMRAEFDARVVALTKLLETEREMRQAAIDDERKTRAEALAASETARVAGMRWGIGTVIVAVSAATALLSVILG